MKKIILFLIIILLSGCTVEYNIEIKDNKAAEKFIIKVNNSEKENLKYLHQNDFYVSLVPDEITYDKKETKKKDITQFNYSHEYNLNDYEESNSLSSCFGAHNILYTKKYITISTSTGIKCMKQDYAYIFDSLKIVLKTNHQVKESNADKVDGYIYTWNIDKNNYSNKNIYIKLYKDKYVFNYENEFYKQIALYGGISCAIIGIVTFIIIKFIKKRKQSNKI